MASKDTRFILLSRPAKDNKNASKAFSKALSAVNGTIVEKPGVELRPREVVIKVAKDADLSPLSGFSFRELDVSTQSGDGVKTDSTTAKDAKPTDVGKKKTPSPASVSESLSSAAAKKGDEKGNESTQKKKDTPGEERVPPSKGKSETAEAKSTVTTTKDANKDGKGDSPKKGSSNFIPALDAELSKLERLKPLPNDMFHSLAYSTSSQCFCYGLLLFSMIYGLLF